jgi:periplasmic mercuric ion binding protein
MNKFSILRLSLALMTLVGLSACGPKVTPNATTEFWVRSNCEMCQETIETALKETEGVATASLNLDEHTVSVSFDSTKVNVEALHKACAKVGYETKLVSADSEGYASLPKCCQKGGDM